jgi:hypothetical protein
MIKVSVSYGMVFDSFDDLKVVDYPHNFCDLYTVLIITNNR